MKLEKWQLWIMYELFGDEAGSYAEWIEMWLAPASPASAEATDTATANRVPAAGAKAPAPAEEG